MTADKSHRFALTGQDPQGRNQTIILWRETDLVGGKVVRRVVLTLDATITTATVLRAQAARKRHPPMSIDVMLDRPAITVPQFAAAIRPLAPL